MKTQIKEKKNMKDTQLSNWAEKKRKWRAKVKEREKEYWQAARGIVNCRGESQDILVKCFLHKYHRDLLSEKPTE